MTLSHSNNLSVVPIPLYATEKLSKRRQLYHERERSIRETEDENENGKLFAHMKIASQYLRCIFQIMLAKVEIKKIKDLVDKICRIYDGK